MKKILMVMVIGVVSLFALGQEVHNFTYERSYYTALNKAKDQNKILMVMVAKKGCPTCAYMKDIVFEREKVLNYLNNNFVTLILDIKGRYYPKRFISHRAPTFFFINPKDESEIREKKVGGSRPWKFLEELQEVKAKYDGADINITVDENQSKVMGSNINVVY
jgi:thioredoxin-related protein